jgi:hypothetical protein
MVKKPSFALTALATLALGIGASTAIFTVVDAALLRGLPYKSPEQLYHVWERTPQLEFAQREFSYPITRIINRIMLSNSQLTLAVAPS